MSESRACLEQITNSEQAKQFRGQKESLIVGKSLSTDTNTNTKYQQQAVKIVWRTKRKIDCWEKFEFQIANTNTNTNTNTNAITIANYKH